MCNKITVSCAAVTVSPPLGLGQDIELPDFLNTIWRGTDRCRHIPFAAQVLHPQNTHYFALFWCLVLPDNLGPIQNRCLRTHIDGEYNFSILSARIRPEYMKYENTPDNPTSRPGGIIVSFGASTAVGRRFTSP